MSNEGQSEMLNGTVVFYSEFKNFASSLATTVPARMCSYIATA